MNKTRSELAPVKKLTDPLKIKAADTYNAAADHFDAQALSFWDKYGCTTIERLKLGNGCHVLDVACGSGASALPAARAVGPQGRVVGLDIAENLLCMGRVKAEAENLKNVEFLSGDMTALDYADESFDTVVCVFGVFFVPDMEALIKELWRVVKPNGKLAITTWGSNFFFPMYEVWRNAVKEVRPDLHNAFNPWDRTADVDSVRNLFTPLGINSVDVTPEAGQHPLRTPEDWWTIVMGSGFRWTIDKMSTDDATRLRQDNLAWIKVNNIKTIETNVIYAVATKDAI